MLRKLLRKGRFKLTSSLVAFAASTLTRKFIDNRYKRSTGKAPPKNPNQKGFKLGQVVFYTAATALAGAAIKIVTRHLGTKKWKDLGGDLPDEIE